MSDNIIYAVDFGTSNSLLAASVNGKPHQPIELDPTDKDPQILRSLIYFPLTGDPSFGKKAIDQYTEQGGEGRFIRSVKKHLPSELFRGTQIHNRFYRLEDLIAALLREMKNRADAHFNQDVKSIVLGRPAKFSMEPKKDQLAQERLKTAAQKAGFQNISFFPEPLAAAFDYRAEVQEEKIVLIVDLGGGTSDFTVIRLGPERFDEKDVLSIGGLSVAGDALDGAVMSEKLSPHFGARAEYRLPMGNNVLRMPPSLRFQLMSPADIVLLSQKDLMQFLKEVRKCTVSERDASRLDQLFTLVAENLGFSIYEEIDRVKRAVCMNGLERISFHQEGVSIDDEITLSEFESYTEKNIHQIFETMDSVISEAGVSYGEIDMICCTGGTSKIPAVKTELSKRFGQDRLSDLNSFQSVIKGLARRASELA